jgi:MoaA/NifB/PqqE/SkfB family radical SAM enzyme
MTIQEFFYFSYSRLIAITSKKLKKSEVFCMSPWIQLHAQTDGNISPCCMSSVHDGNELGNLRLNPDLMAGWNSEKMKALRLNMLRGEKSSICSNCYAHEDIGKVSERNQYNKDYRHYYSRVLSTAKDGSIKEKSIPLIDIRFSNKCNYKCRICNSDYSTLWFEEEIKLGKTPDADNQEKKAATDQAAFYESFKKLLPGVKRLHFAGGEPLFMDEHYQVLDHLIGIGKTDLTLSYNTNFSTLRYKQNNLVKLWNKFKQIDIWASLDGMGERGDYQRKGQKWETIEKNIRTIQAECPTANFGINITVSIFNVLHLPSFLQYIIDQKLAECERINLYPLYYPHHFSILQLPDTIKAEVVNKLEKFEADYLNKRRDTARIKNHIKAILTLMVSEKSTRINEFQHWVKAVDAIRDENFLTTFPELAEMLYDQSSEL